VSSLAFQPRSGRPRVACEPPTSAVIGGAHAACVPCPGAFAPVPPRGVALAALTRIIMSHYSTQDLVIRESLSA
jgi:hypothetical protein